MIKVVIAFINIGPYHFARLISASKFAKLKGFDLKILQVTNDKLEHPWGEIKNDLVSDTHTLSLINEKVEKNNDLKKIPQISQKQVDSYFNLIKPQIIFVPGWSFEISKKIINWSNKNNVRLVLMSETKADDKKRNLLIEIIKSKFIIPKFSAALVGGSLHAKYLIDLGMSKKSIFYGYDVVDNKFFIEKSKSAKLKKYEILESFSIPDKPFFIVVCRLIRRKNIKRLISAYHSYFNFYSDDSWNLIICGSGKELIYLKNYVKDLGLEKKIKFLGFINYKKVAELYGLASCFIHPALSEQWGLVINEAAAAGLPLIISKTVGATSELLKENINGFSIDPHRENEIFEAMTKIHKLSNSEIIQMGKMSKKIVSEFDSNKFGKAVSQIIDYVISE